MPAHPPKKVLFFAPFGLWLRHHQADGMIAKILAMRGANVHIVRCRGLLRASRPGGISQCGLPVSCDTCTAKGDWLFNTLGLPQINMDDHITPADVAEAHTWAWTVDLSDYTNLTFNHVPVGLLATSQLMTTHRIRLDQLDHPSVSFSARSLLYGTYLSYVANERIVDMYEPDSAMIFSARFYPYATAFHVAHQRGINAVVHEVAWYNFGIHMLSNHAILDNVKASDDMTRPWRSIPLTRDEIDHADDTIFGKRVGKHNLSQRFYDEVPHSPPRNEIRRQLGIPGDVRLIGLFTTSQDESWVPGSINGEDHQIPFLSTLFETLKDRDEWLVIRHHPSMGGGGGGTKAPEGGVLRDLYALAQTMPDKVRMIMPNEEISSYSLFNAIDVALSPLSSIGLETVASGIPTVGFAFNHFTRFVTVQMDGLTHDAITDALNAIARLSRDQLLDDMKSVYRTNYWGFLKHSFLFRSFDLSHGLDAHITVSDVDDFLPGADPIMDHVCDHFLIDTPLYYYPSIEDRRRNSADEDAFFPQRLASLDAERNALGDTPAPSRQRILHIIVGEAPALATPLRHPDVTYRHIQSSDGWQSALKDLHPSSLDSFDAVMLGTDQVRYDFTVAIDAVRKLSDDPQPDCVVIAAWKSIPDDTTLVRLTSDEASVATVSDDDAGELVPRILWSVRSFKKLIQWTKKHRQSPNTDVTAHTLAEFIATQSPRYDDRPRMLIFSS